MNTGQIFFFLIIFLVIIYSCTSVEKQRYYYPNGSLKTKAYYNKGSNQAVGEWKTYDESGNLIKIENYNNDQLNGKTTEYYKDGSLKSAYYYEDGFYQGEFKEFYQNGQEKIEGEYKTIDCQKFIGHAPCKIQVRNGKWKFFNASGVVDSVVNYMEIKDVSLEVDSVFENLGSEKRLILLDTVMKVHYDKKVYYQ